MEIIPCKLQELDLEAEIYIELARENLMNKNFEDALTQLNKALLKQTSDLGSQHIDVGTTYQLLGKAYHSTSAYDKAEDCFKKSLDIFLEHCVPGFKIWNAYVNLIKVIQDQGPSRFLDAKKYCQELVNSLPTEFEDESEDLGLYFEVLGDLCSKLENYKEALDLFSRALEIFIQVNGVIHPTVARIYFRMAKIYLQNKEWDKALKNLYAFLELYEKNIQEEKLDEVSDIFLDAAISYNNLKKHEAALDILKRLLQIYPSKSGSDAKVGEIYGVIGDTLIILKDYKEAAKYHNKSLYIFMKAFGHKDLLVARACNRMNLINFKLGVMNRSYLFFRKLNTIGKQLFGGTDAKVLESKDAIALFDSKIAQNQDIYLTDSLFS